MTLKLATLSGFGNQARHRPVRFLLSVLARLQILTPRPHCREICEGTAAGVASAPGRRGAESAGAERPAATFPARRREGGAGGGPAAPEAARGAHGGSVSSPAQPRTARAAASASRTQPGPRSEEAEGRRKRRTGAAGRARAPAVCAFSWRIPVSAGGRAPASRQAWWPQ